MDNFSRTKQNELSFSIIYNYIFEREMNKSESVDVRYIISSNCGMPYDEVDIYIKETVLKCIYNYPELVKIISENLNRWTYERVSLINKAILMYGITNGKYMTDIDKKIIIDICVALSKKFGGNDEYKFINAILDKILW